MRFKKLKVSTSLSPPPKKPTFRTAADKCHCKMGDNFVPSNI